MGERRLSAARVLVVDDEPAELEPLARLIGQWGYEVETAASSDDALAVAESYRPAVVITDLMLPGTDGLSLLQTLRASSRPPIVLLVTGHATVETAVEAMRHGALDYLTKPIDTTRLQLLLEKGVEQESLSREVTILRHELRQRGAFGRFVGQSKRMQEVYHVIELVAPSNASVLVYGESGTGKELAARTIHEQSDRRGRPFIAINCAAIPETLIESELFGHERGAFTGANERRTGCFELADGGTLLLDEVAEMDIGTQAKLLRVLEESSFRRVGGKTELTVDVRVIAATNHVPTEAVASGKLREDLFYRLSVFLVELPALRERPEDIALLAARFIEDFNTQDKRTVAGLTPEAEEALSRYAWPGNVRELRNAIQRAVVLAGSGAIAREHLPPVVLGETPRPARSSESGKVMPLRDLEREMIIRALDEANYHKPQAAAMLGISLKTLYNKLARFGLPPEPSRELVSRSELDAIDHAVRGGLNTTLLNLQLLATTVGLDAPAGPVLERARAEIRRLAELLWPAALGIVALEVKRTERVDLRQLVTSTLPQHGLDQVVLSSGPSPTVSGDPDLLALALVHLARNAVAASPKEGPHPRIDLDVGAATIRVTNACREAIPPVVNGSIAGRRGHLGGLVIVTRVARLHGGSLLYEVVDDQLVARLSLPNE